LPANEGASPQDEADLALLAAAAREAGALIREGFGKTLEVRHKPDGGPVTAIDLDADALLRERLTGARPDYGWLSEESPDAPQRLERQRVFIVDPLDGTRAFVKGEAGFCCALAVIEAGRPRAAAIYDPLADDLYTAASGAGAWRNGAPSIASARNALEGARMVGTPGLYQDRRWPVPWPPLDARPVNAIALRLALVAAGAFDGMIALGPRHEWDIAAGALLVAEAGGLISDPWGSALLFNNPIPRTPGVVAAGAGLHALLLERTRATPPPSALKRAPPQPPSDDAR
jgi:myo-inositol-1(or 4)-monophosphatase